MGSWSPLRAGHIVSLIAHFGQVTSSRKSSGDSNRLPLTDDGGHCAHGNHQSIRDFSVAFPSLVPRDNPVSEVLGSILGFTAKAVNTYERVIFQVFNF